MPGLITRETLREHKALVVELFGVQFWKFAISRADGTPFLSAWAEFNLRLSR